ncbi:MAG: glycine cleavage system protein H [Terriglobia bacterium]|jgi:glycine cleavage system H lipoate-binding protein|nr:glycine cleavage system protein H [Terriglobia bacterium]
MTVILVLATFVAFLLIDHFMNRGKAPVFAAQSVRREPAVPRLQPSLVGGFKVPENFRFHPGHTWALSESPNLVRIGVDDFASKILGNRIESILLPQRGQWIRQGQKVWSLVRNGKKIDMVSPIEGSVADVNDELANNPALFNKDPYGEGWMVTVQSPDAKTNFRNLMGGALARWWTEESALRLSKRLPGTIGALALAQDGGIASSDLTATLPDEKVAEIAHEFFLA